MIYLSTLRCIVSILLQGWNIRMIQLVISQSTSKWFEEKMMEALGIRNFSMRNGLASNAVLAMVYLLTSHCVLCALRIVSLAIWPATIHVSSLKVIPHLRRTAQTILVRQQGNASLVVVVLHKLHKSSKVFSIASLRMKHKRMLTFVLTQLYILCLMVKITSSSS